MKPTKAVAPPPPPFPVPGYPLRTVRRLREAVRAAPVHVAESGHHARLVAGAREPRREVVEGEIGEDALDVPEGRGGGVGGGGMSLRCVVWCVICIELIVVSAHQRRHWSQ